MNSTAEQIFQLVLKDNRLTYKDKVLMAFILSSTEPFKVTVLKMADWLSINFKEAGNTTKRLRKYGYLSNWKRDDNFSSTANLLGYKINLSTILENQPKPDETIKPLHKKRKFDFTPKKIDYLKKMKQEFSEELELPD